jgi:surface protein
MYSMFRNALNFNQNLPWATGRVQSMGQMFFNATSMQGDLSLLDTSNVEDMGGMFSAMSYNRDISMWDVRKTNIMTQM